MATFTFSNKKQQSSDKKTVKKTDFKRNVKIDLIKHPKIDYSPEYYTYINADNEESIIINRCNAADEVGGICAR